MDQGQCASQEHKGLIMSIKFKSICLILSNQNKKAHTSTSKSVNVVSYHESAKIQHIKVTSWHVEQW